MFTPPPPPPTYDSLLFANRNHKLRMMSYCVYYFHHHPRLPDCLSACLQYCTSINRNQPCLPVSGVKSNRRACLCLYPSSPAPTSLSGFCRLRMHTRLPSTTSSAFSSGPLSPNSAPAPVAFVEFKDAECAGQAMSLLQGTFLLSSDRGPIRIEFAKSKMAIIGDTAPFLGHGAGGFSAALMREV